MCNSNNCSCICQVKWTEEDVQELRPDWTPDKCAQLLEKHGSFIEDAMIDEGWKALAFVVEEFESGRKPDTVVSPDLVERSAPWSLNVSSAHRYKNGN